MHRIRDRRIAGRRLPGWLSTGIILWCLTGLFCPSLGAANAVLDEPRYDVHVPASTAADALNRLAEQTGATFLFPYDLARDRQANAVSGRYSLMEALDELLQGSGLAASLSDRGAISIALEGEAESGQEGNPMERGELSAGDEGSRRSGVLGGILTAVTALFGPPDASASEGKSASATQEGSPQVLEEVVVTGTRIGRDGMVTPTPVTAVDAQELSAMSPGSLVEGISQLPQFFSNEGLNSTQPGNTWFTRGGFGQLNLRGLGTNRTLTLVDGRRMISPTAFGGVDINVIPEAMLTNVETVTGGASAAYGTDAVAGVVNFLLDTDFTGIEAHVQDGQTDRNDGDTYEGALALGFDIGDRAHVQVSYEKAKQDDVQSFDGRGWYQGWGTVRDASGVLQVAPNVVSKNASYNGIIFAPETPLQATEFAADGMSVSPFQVSSVTSADPVGIPPANQSIAGGGSGDDFNSQTADVMPEHEREALFLYADYELTDTLKVYAQYINGQNDSWSYNTPGGSFHGTPTALTIFQDNAFLPDSVRQTMIDAGVESFTLRKMGSLSDTLGQSFISTTSKMESYTAGFELTVGGDGFFAGWDIQGYYQRGENTRRGYQHGLRVDRIFAAVDAVVDPATDEIVCRTSLFGDAFPGCQPLNLFGQGNASATALDYVMGFEPGQQITTPIAFADSGFDRGSTTSYTTGRAKVNNTYMDQDVWEIAASGPVSEGWGAGPIDVALGYSYRKEQILQVVHDVTNPASDHSGDFHPVSCSDESIGLRGVSTPDCLNTVGVQYSKVSNIRGQITVDELFLETFVPLVTGAPMAERLAVNLATRWADYSGSGEVWAWKGGLDWQINQDFRLRTTLSRDVRAANLSERFDKTGNVATILDPELNETYNVTIFSGGNPSVEPEEADTFTVGLVYEPSFLPGLSMAVDWYEVDIKGAIGNLTPQGVINQCDAGSAAACDRITRNPETNAIILVGDEFVNIDREIARGVDLELAYRADVEWFGSAAQSLSARAFVTYLDERSETNAGVDKIDRAGQTGIEQSTGSRYALPDYKVTAQLSYTYGGLTAFLQGRYIADGTSENAPPDTFILADNHVDSAFYTDLNLSYEHRTGGRMSIEVFGNVTNLFDEDPPVTPYYSIFWGRPVQTNPSLFDVMGRRYTLGIRFHY